MKTFFALAAALALVISTSQAAEIPPPEIQDTPALKQAKEMRLSTINLRDASVEEALSFIMQKTKAADPKQKGINIALAAKLPEDVTLTFTLTDVSVYDVLQVIAGQADLEIVAADTMIMLAVPKF